MNGWKFNRVTCQTLLGVCCNDYPLKHGNCFSVAAFRGKGEHEDARVVNFCLENLEELVRRGIASFPIEIRKVGGCAFVDDPRIPEEWYLGGKRDRCCEVCAPRDLWTEEQRAEHDGTWEKVGEIELGGGKFTVEECTVGYKAKSKMEEGIFFCPTIPTEKGEEQ